LGESETKRKKYFTNSFYEFLKLKRVCRFSITIMGCCSKKATTEDGETSSNRPSDSKFKQQKLPAWQPILTASTVLPLFFFIGIVFLPIGITLLITSNNIKEKVIEYTDFQLSDCEKCQNDLDVELVQSCMCTVEFKLDEQWDGDVYFYYGLTNFYQNHRRYVRSRDDSQLHGTLSQTVNSNCAPYDKDGSGQAYAPCGAVANSMFNDKFVLKHADLGDDVPFSSENIAWKSDRETKFKNPPGDLSDALRGYSRPRDWLNNVTDLDAGDKKIGKGFLNQDFIVWMRVAAFPTFRKLYRRLDREKTVQFGDGMPAGKYRLEITYNFNVKPFGGKKRFILTTPSWIGGKNPFLGIAYIIVGCLCLVFGFVFLVIHMKIRTRPLTA